MFSLSVPVLALLQLTIVGLCIWRGWDMHATKYKRDYNLAANQTIDWMLKEGYAVGGLNEDGQMELHKLEVVAKPIEKDNENV
jgi:hypothetical protein